MTASTTSHSACVSSPHTHSFATQQVTRINERGESTTTMTEWNDGEYESYTTRRHSAPPPPAPKKHKATEAKTGESTTGTNLLLSKLEYVPTIAETLLHEMSEGEVVTTKSHLYMKKKDGTFHGTPVHLTDAILRDVEGGFIASQLVAGDTITTRGKGGHGNLYEWTKKKDDPTSAFSAKRIWSPGERNNNGNSYGITHDFCIHWKGKTDDSHFYVSAQTMQRRSSTIHKMDPTANTLTVSESDLSLQQLVLYLEALHSLLSHKKTRWLLEHKGDLKYAANFFGDEVLLHELKEADEDTDDDEYHIVDSTD